MSLFLLFSLFISQISSKKDISKITHFLLILLIKYIKICIVKKGSNLFFLDKNRNIFLFVQIIQSKIMRRREKG